MKTFNHPDELKNIITKFETHGFNASEILTPVDALRQNYFAGLQNPTGNCQLFCVSWIMYLLRDFTNPKELLKEMARKFSKKLMLVDVNGNDREKLIALYGDKIILDSSYKSTNGSSMNIMIINVFN